MDEITLLLDLNQTLKKFRERRNRVSWTRLSDFNSCQASCFVKNYAAFSGDEVLVQDFTKALAGSIIQKVMEVFINKRIYLRREMGTLEDLVRWCQLQFRRLYDTMAFELAYQHRPEFKVRGGYYTTKKGKAALLEQQLRGLDVAFERVEPCFISKENLTLFFGSEEKFLLQHERLFGPILECFLREGIVLNQVISEQKVECTVLGEVELLGYIDFLYNQHGAEWELFDKFQKLQNYYVILDGKYKVASYVEKEQLFWYAAILYWKTNRLPEWVAFMDWNKATLIRHDFNPTYLELAKHQIHAYVTTMGNLQQDLERIKLEHSSGYILLEDFSNLAYSPSQGNCLFCPIRTACQAALEQGCTGIPKGVLRKAATVEYCNSLNLDPSKHIHDITM